MANDLSYVDTISCHGVVVPKDTNRLSPRMIDVMENNRYERPEVQSLEQILTPDDRVMELGAGVGVVSTIAARIVGGANVVCVEADPELIPLLRETHRLNGIDGVNIVSGAVTAQAQASDLPFHRRKNFWASSISQRKGDARDTVATVPVPAVEIGALSNGSVRPCWWSISKGPNVTFSTRPYWTAFGRSFSSCIRGSTASRVCGT
jgi:FkbM family methyltransferase